MSGSYSPSHQFKLLLSAYSRSSLGHSEVHPSSRPGGFGRVAGHQRFPLGWNPPQQVYPLCLSSCWQRTGSRPAGRDCCDARARAASGLPPSDPFRALPVSLSLSIFSCSLLPTPSLFLSSPSLLGRTYYKPTLSNNFCKRCPTFITFVFNIFLTYKELTARSSMIDVLISSKLSLTKHIIFIQ